MKKIHWVVLVLSVWAGCVFADEEATVPPLGPSVSDEEILGDEPLGLLGEAMGTTVCTNETKATEEIKTLARALQNDPVKIYSFVRNQIDYRPTRGIHMGAAACLEAKRGNGWDQAALLNSLLRTAGYPTRFVSGRVIYWRDDASAWLGAVSNRVEYVLSSGGLLTGSVTGHPGKMYVDRVWVEAQVDGGWYTLDPAFKEYEWFNPTNLLADIGYNRTHFLSAVSAGSTITSNYIQQLSSSNLYEQLTTCTTNLRAHIREESPNAFVEEVLGGQRMIERSITNLSTTLPYAYWVSSSLQRWDHIQEADQCSLRILHEGLDVSLKGYEAAGRRISVFYDENNGYRPNLYLDGSIISTGNTTTVGNDYTVTVLVDHPYTDSTHADTSNDLSVVSGGRYSLVHDLGDASAGQVQRVSDQLRKNLSSGVSAQSEAVSGGALYLAASSYMQQKRLAKEHLARAREVEGLQHHWIGVVGQEEGFYIDLPGGRSGTVSLTTTNTANAEIFYKAKSFMDSALEHGVFEQTQHKACVSTVRLLCLNNGAEDRTYFADSNNWDSIKGSLPTYSPTQKNKFEDLINQGYYLILPENADITLEEWEGHGYFKHNLASTHLGAIISGGYNGGDAATEGEIGAEKESEGGWWNTFLGWFGIDGTESLEPVDLFTGNYLSESTDLTLGSGSAPKGLQFSRYYDSGIRDADTGIGFGWRHSADIRANVISDPESALGARSPTDAAAHIVQSLIIDDLMSDTPDARDWLLCSMIANWQMENLTTNAVRIEIGNKETTFIQQPDETYSSAPNVRATLEKQNGAFILKGRFGTEYRFRTDGWIDEIIDADSNTLTFAYTAQTNLQTITDTFGRTLSLAYNASNRISTVTDSTGRQIAYGYDATGNLTTTTDPESNTWTYQYDTNHQITAIIDPENITTIQNHYDPTGCVTQQISATSNAWNFYIGGGFGIEEDPAGGQTIHRFDADGRNLGTENALGHKTQRIYDGQGHLVTQIDARSVTNRYAYDADHNLITQTEALGTPEERTTTYGYDQHYRLTAITNALGHVTCYQYDAEHHLVGMTNALGDATAFEYFPNGLLKKKTEDGGRITDFSYDSYGNPNLITSTDAGTVDLDYNARGELVDRKDAKNQSTTYSYNLNGKPLSVFYPDGSSVSNTYWDNGLLKTTTDAKGETVSKVWNNAYKLQSVTFPDGGTVSNSYDSADRLIATKDTKGNTSSNTLDAVGRILHHRGHGGTQRNFSYDSSGNPTNSSIDPTGLNLWTTTEFDVSNRPLNHQSSIANQQFSYDLLGRQTNRIDAASKHWKTEYDALSRPVKSIRPSGAEEQTGYNALGYRTSFTNAEGKVISFGLDAQGRVTSITNAINNVTSFDYDLNGNLVQRTDAEGKTTDYSFDEMNRLTNVIHEGTWKALFEYDLNGNNVAQASPLASLSLEYDSMNRLESSLISVNSRSFAVTNAYDLNGNRTNIVYPGGLAVAYEYDEENRLESVDLSDFGLSTFDFSYDGASRLTNIVYPNGVSGDYVYDAESRILEYAYSSGSNNFLRHVIQRDPRGLKIIEDVYEGLLPNFTNEVHQTRTHNDADQLLTAGDLTHSYNANGCLTSSVSSAQSVDYSYDFDNRLTSADDVEYLYDASGARIARIAGISPAVTNYFVIDYTDPLKRPLAETDSSGIITRYYIWAGFKLLAHIEADGTTRYYHSDELDSTLALTDESGNVTDQFAYSPYGQELGRIGNTETPFRWLGGYGVYYDAETDLHLTLHRAYSARQKRFLSSDPLGIDGGVNLYAYGNLNPVNFIDPYGLAYMDPGDIGFAGMGGVILYATKKLGTPGFFMGVIFDAYVYKVTDALAPVPDTPGGWHYRGDDANNDSNSSPKK